MRFAKIINNNLTWLANALFQQKNWFQFAWKILSILTLLYTPTICTHNRSIFIWKMKLHEIYKFIKNNSNYSVSVGQFEIWYCIWLNLNFCIQPFSYCTAFSSVNTFFSLSSIMMRIQIVLIILFIFKSTETTPTISIPKFGPLFAYTSYQNQRQIEPFNFIELMKRNTLRTRSYNAIAKIVAGNPYLHHRNIYGRTSIYPRQPFWTYN